VTGDGLGLALVAFGAVAGGLIAGRLRPELAPDWPDVSIETCLLAGAAGAAALALDGGTAAAASCTGLTAAAVLDACSGYLVDELTLPTAAIALLASIDSGSACHSAFGMLTLALPPALLNVIGRGRWLGWGDVKAFLAVGAGLGSERGIAALGLACIFGVATALVTRRREIRFGPHLAAGALAALGGAP
jgi:prepilin signal peptidase PulO-like enzyme (type II secretory pathway)